MLTDIVDVDINETELFYSIHFNNSNIPSQAEEYGACTAVLEPYFVVIQAGDLRSYFNRNTDRKRLIYGDNTVKIRREYGCKSPAWITEKYDPNTAVYDYVTFVYRAP